MAHKRKHHKPKAHSHKRPKKHKGHAHKRKHRR